MRQHDWKIQSLRTSASAFSDAHHQTTYIAAGLLREQFLMLAVLLRIENHQPRMKLVMHLLLATIENSRQ